MAQGAVGETAPSQPDPPAPNLAKAEGRLAQRYDRLELLAGRLAELSRSTQPRRARLLRDLIAMSRERDVSGRFAAIIGALQTNDLGAAVSSQQDLQGDLKRLLNLLLQEDRSRQLESQRKRISKYLEEVKKLIRLQRGIKARTEGGDARASTADDQHRVAQGTGKLHDKIEENEDLGETNSDRQAERSGSGSESQSSPGSRDAQPGSSDAPPGESQPNDSPAGDSERKADPGGSQQSGDAGSPHEQSGGAPSPGGPAQEGPSQSGSSESGSSESDSAEFGPSQGEPPPAAEEPSPMERAAQRLKHAQQRMQQAKSRLDQAQRENALEKQAQALRALEQAKSELERILRQLREEELERTLVLLEARFRKMLEDQIAIYDETKKLALQQPQAARHEVEIASGRLGRREESIVHDADRALVLLREDGTSVAFPEAVLQTRNDMATVARRLGDVKLEKLTQGLEEDIIESLEEILAALRQALQELREQQPQQQQAEAGQPGEQPLVDRLAELRMIRALQSRVNRRTQRYGEMLGERQAAEEDLRQALADLGRRQESVFHATRDLESGRNN